MYAANVDGTRNIIEAAAKAGCSRIVYTSTVGCIGLPKKTAGIAVPTDEDTPVTGAQMSNPYKKSKWQAEVIARDLASKGLPVVIVNPTAPIGPKDVKPTPTGQVIVDYLNGRMPAYLDTGLNWVHALLPSLQPVADRNIQDKFTMGYPLLSQILHPPAFLWGRRREDERAGSATAAGGLRQNS